MTVAELIEGLEKLQPDTTVLIPTGDFWGNYRAPNPTGYDFLCLETSQGTWADVTDKERERDQLAISL